MRRTALFLLCMTASIVPFFSREASAQVENILFSFANNGSDGSAPAGALVLDASGNLYGTTSAGGPLCMGASCGMVFQLTPMPGGNWEEQILYEFAGADGDEPWGSLISDGIGNLYGTTYGGGAYGCGVIFELSKSPSGNWNETVLHSFQGYPIDGCQPQAGVIRDGAGNLYGTTFSGGSQNCGFPLGCGTAFELSPQGGGAWTEKILHDFGSGKHDGHGPTNSGLVFDAAGNLYGTTSFGGLYDNNGFGGTVFELAPKGHGRWAEKILHSFAHRLDGVFPEGTLAIDPSGNLFGMTYAGGTNGWGIVFEVSRKLSGKGWKESVLHNFANDGVDGYQPEYPGLILDSTGNIYGTTTYGGANKGGIVFELTSSPGSKWAEKVLHAFSFNTGDGYAPFSGLVRDSAGNLYGTTASGGTGGTGTVFEITP